MYPVLNSAMRVKHTPVACKSRPEVWGIIISAFERHDHDCTSFSKQSQQTEVPHAADHSSRRFSADLVADIADS